MMEQSFTLAQPENFAAVLSIFKKAIEHMNSQAIYQWDELYPNEDVLQTDIKKQQMYVLQNNNIIVSAIILNEEQDKQYQDADWNYKNGKIAVIHRLCVDPGFQNKGIAQETIRLAEHVLLKKGYSAVRLDAFSQNPYALKLYSKIGYKNVGEVIFRKGIFYLFEKPL